MKKMISLMTLLITGFVFSGNSIKHSIETTKKPLKPLSHQKKSV